MKIVFFGSDDFALAHLKALSNSDHDIVGCVTQPDRKRDRGMKLTVSPLKEYADKNRIPCLQPDDINNANFAEELSELNADIFVVIAYGRILPQSILDIPPKGAVNVHGSLLPKYRGAAPINWAIINGDKQTGLSVIVMNTKMDAGDILGQKEVAIATDDTSISLRAKMMDVGPHLLLDVLSDIENGKANPVKQNESEVTAASKLTKEMGEIDWAKSAEEIYNLIRGLLPWPAAFCCCNDKKMKILSSKIVSQESTGKPGEVVCVDNNEVHINTGRGVLALLEVQPESAKRMSAAEFLCGQRLKEGCQFV